MNINEVEKDLAKYHLLHFVIGAIVGAVLFAVPKFASALIGIVLLAVFMPTTVVPIEFIGSRWIDRLAILAGALGAAAALHYLKRI
jgi:hypothetical protein